MRWTPLIADQIIFQEISEKRTDLGAGLVPGEVYWCLPSGKEGPGLWDPVGRTSRKKM